MGKILEINDIIEVSKKLRDQGRSIVLAGGCFDLLHIGHVRFLSKAKTKGDVLMLLLEHDESVAKLKGLHRPIHTQQDRAKLLAALKDIDYVVLLPSLMTDDDYSTLIMQIKPAIIATTKHDPARSHKERHAKMVNAIVVDVIDRVSNQSTSKLAEIVAKEFNI